MRVLGLLFAALVGCGPTTTVGRIMIPDSTGDEIVGVRAGDTLAYVLRRGDRVVLVDAGSEADAGALLAELTRMGKDATNVEVILLTCGRRAHFAGAAAFPRATVFVGQADHLLVRGEALPGGALPKLLARLSPRPPAPRRVRVVLAGTVLPVAGRRFEVIATPGHTRGSLMFLHANILFTGDSLLLDGDGLAIAPWYLSASTKDNRRSLTRLAPLPVLAIADGHNGYAADAGRRLARLFGDIPE